MSRPLAIVLPLAACCLLFTAGIRHARCQDPQPADVVGSAPPSTDEAPPSTDEAPPSSTPAAGTPPVLTLAAVEQALKTAQESKELDEPARAELVKRYNSALELLREGEAAAGKTAAYEAELGQGAQLIQELKTRLSLATVDRAPRVAPDGTLSQLEQLLGEAELQLQTAREDLAQREDELKRRGERTAELTKLTAQTAERLQRAQERLALPPADHEVEALREARRIERTARVWSLERQAALLKSEARRYEALSELFPLRRDWAQRVVASREREVAAWRKLVARRRALESEHQVREARRQVQQAHPALRSLAERNAALADLRKSTAAAIDTTRNAVTEVKEQLALLESDARKVRERVERASHATTLGVLLRKQRESLPSRVACQRWLRLVEQQTPQVQLKLMELEEERAPLGDLKAVAAQIVAGLHGAIKQSDPEDVQQMVGELLETKRDLLDQVASDQDTYIRDLSELELWAGKLIAARDEFADYMDEHVLWIRSAEALKLADFPAALRASAVLAHPRHWIGLARQLRDDVPRHPWYTGLLAAAGLLVCLLSHRLQKRLQAICQLGAQRGVLQFLPTLEGLLVVGILAAPWPGSLLFVAWRLRAERHLSDFNAAVASGLLVVAVLLWASGVVRGILRAEGLGEKHFGWQNVAPKAFRRHLCWLTGLGLPLAFTATFSYRYLDGQSSGSLGRIAFIAGMGVLAAFCHFVFHPEGRLFRACQSSGQHGLLVRCRRSVYVLSIGSALTMAGLAIAGYYYSAQQLVIRLQWTATMLGGFVLIHAVVSRWFLVKRRNLAISQARERLAASQEAEKSDGPVNVDLAQPDLSAIHTQLQYLLGHAVTVGVLLASWMIWSDVLPALRILDRVELWNHHVEVTEWVEDTGGQRTRETVQRNIPTTARHALVAVLVVIVTWVVGRNLPALLEITLLERLPLDRGGRYAVSIIVRYAVTLAGAILACRALHISWVSVQWLAAAMTVGLGFGLQEIFANFVSGLIILFERPVRVGDLVTVGGVSGHVTRMQMRATTITGFDRRELIVPNKKFITDDVLNWTLSDHINRIVIEVGVAYGSDTELTRQLLLRVAEEHPLILRDPPPLVALERFADSALTFSLRCFLPGLEQRLMVIHDLHVAIERELRHAGIDIAFPQREIRVRAVPPLTPQIETQLPAELSRTHVRAEAA